MDEQKIQELLRRYFDGATSIEEERKLQQFFTQEEVPESLKQYLPLFAFFVKEQKIEPPLQNPAIRTIRMPWLIITGIAASVAILFLIAIPKEIQPEEFVYYVDGKRVYDEAEAVRTASDKLQLMSMAMQRAANSMSAFEKVQVGASTLRQIEKVQEAYYKAESMIKIENQNQ